MMHATCCLLEVLWIKKGRIFRCLIHENCWGLAGKFHFTLSKHGLSLLVPQGSPATCPSLPVRSTIGIGKCSFRLVACLLFNVTLKVFH